MGNYSILKAAINDVIKANGEGAITGNLLNQVLTTMVNSLGDGYQFVGVATPSTNPGTPDQNVFYLATEEGVYVNFNNVQIYGASLKIFKWDGTWETEDILDLVGFEQKMDEVVAWLQTYQPIVIEGNVNNAPDEEDLTSVDEGGTNVLKFKDKAYAPALFSGLGRKYLRKNIVNGVNTLTQEMMSDDNTIYIIQYDFTLGEDITIPANCVLEFDGGSLNGSYTLTGQNTAINTSNTKILYTNVIITGTWNVDICNANWFLDDNNNFSNNIKRALVISKNVHIPEGKYTLKDALTITTNAQIKGDGYENTILLLEGSINVSKTLGTLIEGIAFGKSDDINSLDYYIKLNKGFSNNINRCAFYGNENVACGIILDAELGTKGYFTAISYCRITSFPIGVKCTNNSNANTIDTNEFYNCDVCVLIDSCNGVRVINNTFQTFNTVGVKFIYSNQGSITRGNLVCGNYFEGIGENLIADIDFDNNENCNNNYILGNNFTYLTGGKPHIANMVSENLILESTRNTLNRFNLLPGFTKFQNLNEGVLRDYVGDRFAGVIVPIKSNNGNNVDFYIGLMSSGTFGWRKLCTYTANGHFSPGIIDANQINFYEGGTLTLPYGNVPISSRTLCYERWRELLKYANYDANEWNYIQNVKACTSTTRPIGGGFIPEGYMVFDKSLGRPIWYTGNTTSPHTGWVDATGADV